MTTDIVIHNIGELYTLAPLASAKKRTQISRADLGLIQDAWIAVAKGRVQGFGHGKVPDDYKSHRHIDAQGGLLLPGLVDCHTHPVFGGNRSFEFAKRLDGATYQEIAAAGGGILSTVKATREASLDELTKICQRHCAKFLEYGVTTLEAKSGYGLTVNDELKLLEAIKETSHKSTQTIVPTLLALHAVPKDTSKEAFIAEMTDVLLAKVREKDLAQFVDAFVEKGYFEVEDAEPYINKAKELGFKVRIHADEFADSGAAQAAADWKAHSADHLEKASAQGIDAMSKAGVTAVLLPGTSLYCDMEYTDARKFLDANCPVALATDYNPGSCRVENLSFIATLGALHCKLDTATTLAAITYVPACSLDLGDTKGHLSVGADHDMVLFDYKSLDDWIADLGQRKPILVHC